MEDQWEFVVWGEQLKRCTFLNKAKTAFLMFKKFENLYFGYI